VIFLLTDRLEQLLPTIRSRCLVLQIETEQPTSPSAANESSAWVKNWLTVSGSPADQAYRRAGQLSAHWKKLREQIDSRAEAKAADDEDSMPAFIEAEYLLARDNSIRALILSAWSLLDNRAAATVIVSGLEDLRHALSRNIEPNLALECACLKMSGLIEER
jgi:hypothetical protein